MQVAASLLHLRQVAQRQQRSIIVSTMQHSQDKVLLHVRNLLLSWAQHAASCSLTQVCIADLHSGLPCLCRIIQRWRAQQLTVDSRKVSKLSPISFQRTVGVLSSASRKRFWYGVPRSTGSLFVRICSADAWLHLSISVA